MFGRWAWQAWRLASTWNLVRHEARVLWQNRMACLVLLFVPLCAVSMRLGRERRPASVGETCYVVYWEEDDWVRDLKAAAASSVESHGVRIDVVAADSLTGSDGIIRYPPGSHSIQLRSFEEANGDRPGRLIWYWYHGTDPAALWPYARWFQQVTLEHFGGEERWRDRISPMRPELVVFGEETQIAVGSQFSSEQLDVVMVWLVLFFTACHLPKLSLAAAKEGRMLDSLAVSPIGWDGAILAVRLFYGTLAVALATVTVAILNPSLLTHVTFWITTISAAVIYLGVSIVIASWCGSVASAGVATTVYLATCGLIYGITISLSGGFGTEFAQYTVAEAGILHSLHRIWNPEESGDGTGVLLAVVAWAMIWHALGDWSYRRLGRQ